MSCSQIYAKKMFYFSRSSGLLTQEDNPSSERKAEDKAFATVDFLTLFENSESLSGETEEEKKWQTVQTPLDTLYTQLTN